MVGFTFMSGPKNKRRFGARAGGSGWGLGARGWGSALGRAAVCFYIVRLTSWAEAPLKKATALVVTTASSAASEREPLDLIFNSILTDLPCRSPQLTRDTAAARKRWLSFVVASWISKYDSSHEVVVPRVAFALMSEPQRDRTARTHL